MSALALHGLGKPVAFAGEDHNVGMVDQPVNQRCHQAVVGGKIGIVVQCRGTGQFERIRPAG